MSRIYRVFRKILKNKPIDIHLVIPGKVILSVALILMALTGKIGATIAIVILIFLVLIFLIPDDI